MASPSRNFSLGSWWISLPRPLLIAIAALFCAATVVYAALWMYNMRNFSAVELGFNKFHDEQYSEKTHSIVVGDVVSGSPAEKAGLKAGDRIIGVNGKLLTTSEPYDRAYAYGHPGDPVELIVQRDGEPGLVIIHGIFRANSNLRAVEGLARSSVVQVINSLPVFFVLVGFAVLFLRVQDANAWLLALTFVAFACAPAMGTAMGFHSAVRRFVFEFRALFDAQLPALFYCFFAVFPVRSPLDKRLPWLKWAGVLIAATTMLPGWRSGEPHFPRIVSDWIGGRASLFAFNVFRYGFIVLGLLSLTQNALSRSTPAEAARKSRVILFGTVVGVLPVVVERAIADFTDRDPSFWVNAVILLLFILYPLSFAYAVVKHRVMEIPALLRRSARYVLVQRSYFLLLFCGAMLAIALFTRFFAEYFAQHSQFGMALSAVFGVALVWVSGPFVKRGTDRIDRAFFRSAYDARVILQELAEETRTVTDRQELARLLQQQIEGALHPRSLACYLETKDGELTATSETLFPGPGASHALQPLPRPKFPVRFGARFTLQDEPTIAKTSPLIEELARHGKAWDVPSTVSEEMGESAEAVPECLVPIVGRNSGLMGLLVLGTRLSEEPYSSEDKRLLDAVADQAATTLENIRLAEQIAQRLEAERRVAREMDIARDVQARLFPQVMPKQCTLEYAGACLQAREVGGDYYDFWDLGAQHLALVLADISGKGISGALLMANLQANLRSRSTVARQDLLNVNRDGKWLPGMLKAVNELFYENTADDRYATLFLAVYDDASGELEYANCGHNPPLVFRANGGVERLCATASVIGFTDQWQCTTETIRLKRGDVLVIYTDGVTEANDAGANEFGEERLKQVVKANLSATPQELLAAIQRAVQKFSYGEQFDDLTLIVARTH